MARKGEVSQKGQREPLAEVTRKYRRAELEAEKNKGKSKRKQLTTEAKRDKG
jgi:hypothetical protein